MKIEKQLTKNPSFKKLWLAHALSQLSGYTLIFLVVGKTFEVTTSNIASGMLWISFTIPTLFLSPFVGSLIDLWNKQKILVLTNFLQWLVIYGFAISFSIDKPYLAYPLLFLYAAIGTINDPAEMAKIPGVVEKSHLLVANNLLFFTDHASLIFSSVLAGVLLKIVSLPIAISIIASMPLVASFVASTLPEEKNPDQTAISLSTELEKLIDKIRAGYQFLSQNRLILYSFSLMIAFKVLLATTIILLPDFSKNILRASVYDAGFMVVLPLAIGLISGTIILGKYQGKTRKWRWIGRGLLMLGVNFLLLIFLNPANLVSRRFFNVLLAVLAGVSVSIINAPVQSFIQEVTPKDLRGQTFSTLAFFTTLASIPSVFISTALSEILGIKAFLTIIAIAILSLGFYVSQRGNEIVLSTNNRH